MKISTIVFYILFVSFIWGCRSINPSVTESFYCGFISENIEASLIEKLVENGETSQNVKIDSLVRAIVELTLPYKDFRLIEDKTGEVRTAFAYRDRKGGRYIIYNRQVLESIDLKNPNESSVALGVLSHEIGHLLYGHYGRSSRQLEIIADEYSGWVQKKFGVTESNSWLGVHRLTTGDNVNGTETHPPLNDRKKAIERGWSIANTDSRYRYSNCCDTSFYSYFTIEGLVFNKSLNEGNTSVVDFTIITLDNEGKEVEVFDKQIIYDQNIIAVDNNPVILFKELGWVIKNRMFTVMQFEICSCQTPCDGIKERNIRQCRKIQKHVKSITENLVIPFDNYGYLKLIFKK